MNPRPDNDPWDRVDIEDDPITEQEVIDVSDTESVSLLDDGDDDALMAAADDYDAQHPDPEPDDDPPENIDYLTCEDCAMPYDITDANDYNRCRPCRVQRFLHS